MSILIIIICILIVVIGLIIGSIFILSSHDISVKDSISDLKQRKSELEVQIKKLRSEAKEIVKDKRYK